MWSSERGAVAPFAAGLISILLLAMLGAAGAVTATIAATRIQGVADSVALYSHDRAKTNLSAAHLAAAEFLLEAPSARRLIDPRLGIVAVGDSMHYRLCAGWLNPLPAHLAGVSQVGGPAMRPGGLVICRVAVAKSYLLDFE